MKLGQEDLCYLPANDILKLFKTRDLSPIEYLQALISRTEELNQSINAFTDCYFDEALEKAAIAENNYSRSTNLTRPLEGIPVAVKDAQRVKGKRTSYGSLIFMNSVDETSDPMIERLEAAGAIIHARTTTPEFCLSSLCQSRAWGTTYNPHNKEYGPGGSSGGSGASLAAGFAPLATGTDIGGSVRIPAACCGVVGFKPPHGRNPDGPPANFDRYNHCGPMARSVRDIALVQNVVSGAHPRDHDSLRQDLQISNQLKSIKDIKIAWSMDFDYLEIDTEVIANTHSALEVFRDLGAKVEQVRLNWSTKCDEATIHWLNAMHFYRQTIWHAQTHSHLMTDYALATAKLANKTQLDDVARSWETQHEMYQTFGAIMDQHDIFIYPTNAISALKINHDPTNNDFKINGIVVDPEYGWILTHHFNMLHNCPVMAVPSGYASNNVPTGIQIVGRTFDDEMVFGAALAYEYALGGWFQQSHQRPKFH